jgi:hypothetical protein
MASKRPCRYGTSCRFYFACGVQSSTRTYITHRNPTCAFSHDVAATPAPSFGAPAPSFSAPSSSAQPCRYGASCKRFDCRFFHPTPHQNTPHQNTPYQQPVQQPPSMSSPSMTPCRFGMACTAPNCRFFHDDDEEFSPEEEERIDEILDMIEQEQRARDGGLGGDEEDDKNIDEIFAYIQNQQQASSSQPTTMDDFSLPEGADEEYEAMLQQQPPPYYAEYLFLPLFSPFLSSPTITFSPFPSPLFYPPFTRKQKKNCFESFTDSHRPQAC